jgi:hypothetical protein
LIHVHYITAFYGIPKIFTLYSKQYTLPNDTGSFAFDTSKLSLFPASSSRQEKMAVSGYKSVGVSIGSFGQVNLEQGLDVRIGGDIRPQTTLSAHLSDQGSSLDGATREISDFDMIYIGLDDPNYRAVAGDQYISWPFKGILTGEKKIKGLSAEYGKKNDGPFTVGAFGALSGGVVTTETKQGRTGVQGPYTLTGNGVNDFIQPVSGTVKVRINGRELEEGNDKDFTVDYSLGTITFTPKNLVKDEDLIRIEYEYKQFFYQRTLIGATTAYSGPDSLFTVQGVVWSESDNKNDPIDLTLSDTEITELEHAGDQAPMASTARPVHPNDVASESQFYPLYKRHMLPDSTAYYVYAPFDVNHPDSVLGYYYVWFHQIKSGEKGNYQLSFSDNRGAAYVYVGGDSGSYSDLSAIPAPERKTNGEMKFRIHTTGFEATLDVAGQEHDKNLFSTLGDVDNTASATDFSFTLGSKATDRRSAWLSGNHRFTSNQFDAEVLSAYDRKEQWDDVSLTQQDIARQQWETRAGATIVPRLTAELAYGQDRTASELTTDKLSPGLHYAAWGDRLTTDYSGSFFRHLDPGEKGAGRRESENTKLTLGKNVFGLLYSDEWRADSVGQGSGLYQGGLSYEFLPLALREQVSYVSRAKSTGGFFTKDTGFSVRLEQSIDHTLLPGWRLNGSGNVDHSVDYGLSSSTTMLVDLVSDVDKGDYGFTSRQHYRTSEENASSFIQVPVFAGKGLGTYAYDSLRKEYVPSPQGDYFMQQKEIYDQTSGQRIKKTSADINWTYRPRKKIPGILGDLGWQGTLNCEEYVDADQTGVGSWVPGFLSLASLMKGDSMNNNSSDPVQYANISYRQDIDWMPKDSQRTYSGNFHITPAYSKIRNYTENSLESRLEVNKTMRKFTIGGALNVLSLGHIDTAAEGDPTSDLNYTLLDRRVECTQKYRLVEPFSITLLEAFGLAQKEVGTGSHSLPFDSMFYYQVAPSFSWQPGKKGTMTGTYTYSVVPLPGDLDYRMARGFGSGIEHRVSITADVKIGERLMIIGSYRGDMRKIVGEVDFEPPNNVFSLEVRAYM